MSQLSLIQWPIVEDLIIIGSTVHCNMIENTNFLEKKVLEEVEIQVLEDLLFVAAEIDCYCYKVHYLEDSFGTS